MKLLIKGLTRFNDGTIWLCKQVEIILIALMMIIVLIQVFFRYVLNNSLVWPEETARFMMVWMTFMAAPIAYRAGSNVSLDIVHRLLKGRMYTLLSIIIQIAAIATISILFQKSLGMVERGMNIDATSIPIKMTYVYLCLPIGLSLTVVVAFEVLINSLVQLVTGVDMKPDPVTELSGEEGVS